MSSINLHNKKFDEATLTKLELFEDYAKEWIPTFVMSGWKRLCIFDYFAGPGYDIQSIPGSPIRILRQIKEQIGNIFQASVNVTVYFNEYDKEKYKHLCESTTAYINSCSELKRAISSGLVKVSCLNESFEELFPKTLSYIADRPSLLYFDQNGVKFLSDRYLLEIEKMATTDFLYFVSSSYIGRFGNTPEFQDNIQIDMQRIKKSKHKYIHQELLTQLKEHLPQNSKLRLYPFTIKKGTNIYGLIFGSSHPRGVDKFLKTAWKKNTTNGAANFDIDDDEGKGQLDLFNGKILTKIEKFQQALEESVLSGEIRTNKDAYDYTIAQGHISSHATIILRRLKKEGKIIYDSTQPLISYENVYGKRSKIIDYKIIK